ncbi:AAA-like domain-containing protein [Chloroflexi bacterium TSY]|nr:AAA-like domain-containing protein [Chloroflexi bacterium TSY]
MITILFLAANPADRTQLRLSEEIRVIEQALSRAEFRDSFDIKQHWEVRVSEIQELLLRHQPDIVHFSGHSDESSRIILHDDARKSQPISKDAIGTLFAVLQDNIKCIVLNTCYSEEQAQIIAQHIDCVIGISAKINDSSAIKFASSFYQALGYGRAIQTAFELGRLQIKLENLGEEDRPRLLAKDIDAFKTEFTNIKRESQKGSSPQTPSLMHSDHTLEPPTGNLAPDSALYIERKADADCLNYFSRDHAVTVYIQAPSQMGRRSLMQRTLYQIEQKQVFINFEEFLEEQLQDREQFFLGLCQMISDNLEIPDHIDEYWNPRRTVLINCKNYMAKYIIPTINQRFVLAMDEVDRVFGAPFQNDFFGMLRTWHNLRSHKDQNFSQMSLFLGSSTEPEKFIDDHDRSPFNVALPILLEDFSRDEIDQLHHRHGSPVNQPDLDVLIRLLGGHPFLIRLAFYLLATSTINFDQLMGTATSDDGPFGSHLRRYWHILLDNRELQSALRKIWLEKTHPEDRLFYRLKGLGLIKKVGNQIVLRNHLYELYFTERLNHA